jgi:hypothetical protein
MDQAALKEFGMEDKMCPCGKPLHYSNPQIRALVEGMIAATGEHVTITITETGRSYRVPKHFIALHGVKGCELPALVGKYGIEEVE